MNKNVMCEMKSELTNAGYDLMRLTHALSSEPCSSMPFKLKCEFINRMRLNYADLRFTPEIVLKRHLGIDMVRVIEIGLQQAMINGTLDYLVESVFHISHIRKNTVVDFGFMFGSMSNDENKSIFIDALINEKVISLDHQSNTFYPGPQIFSASAA